MFAGYTYWSLRDGTLRAGHPDRARPRRHVRRHPRPRGGDRAPRLQAAPGGVAAREAGRVARRPAHPAGVDAASRSATLRSRSRPCCPRDVRSSSSGGSVPLDRFLLAGIVIATAAVLAALYRWSRFGLATRAASENEVSAMLAGLSPSRLSMANTLLACLVAGGLGVLAASITVLYWQTLPLYIVPALAAALFARFTSFGIACAVGLSLGMAQSALLYYIAPKPWFPTDHGIALPGVWDLFVFGVIVIAMFWRGASLPGRGELIEKRLPLVPSSERLGRNALLGTAACAIALVVFPWDFRQALIVSLLASLICLSLRHHHRLRRADLRRAGRSRRGGGVHGLPHGDRLRHRVPARAAHRRGGGDGARAPRRGLRAACPRRQPRRRHAGRGGRDREVRLRQLPLGRRFRRVARASAEDRPLQPRAGLLLARPRRRAAEPRLRLLPPRAHRRDLPRHRERATLEPRQTDAGGALERACGRRRRRERDGGQAHGLRSRGVHRRSGRRHVQLRVRRRARRRSSARSRRSA